MFDGNHRSGRRVVNLSGKRKQKDKKTVLEQSRLQRAQRQLLARQTAAAVVLQKHVRGNRTRDRLRLVEWKDKDEYLNGWLGLVRNREEEIQTVRRLVEYAERIGSSTLTTTPTPSARSIVQSVLQHVHRLSSQQVELILTFVLDLNNSSNNKSSDYYWNRLGPAAFGRMGELVCDPPNKETQRFLYSCICRSVPSNNAVEGTTMLVLLSIAMGNNTKDATSASMTQLLQGLHWMESQSSSISSIGSAVQQILSQHAVTILNAAARKFVQSKDSSLATQFVALFQLIVLNGGTQTAVIDDEKSSGQRIHLLWGLNRCIKGIEEEAHEEAGGEQEAQSVHQSMDEDSDDEDDEKIPATEQQRSTKTAASKVGLQARKDELRTVQKLDKLNTTNVSAMDTWYNRGRVTALGSYVMLADPSLWLGLGSSLLSSQDDESSSDVILSYLGILGTLLQATTGLEPRQNASRSQLLNKLAFATDFVDLLWKFLSRRLPSEIGGEIKTKTSYSTEVLLGLSVFCDVFAHASIALRDHVFLARYTNFDSAHQQQRSSPSPTVLQAEDVIQKLKPVLFDMYWANPVIANHVKVFVGNKAMLDKNLTSTQLPVVPTEPTAVRGRLLLSGTKLWNSLYNRWARLVRSSPFCDESVWWFPSITTLSAEGAVAAHGVNDAAADNDDAMDVEDDDSMDWDGAEERKEDVPDESSILADAFRDPKMARVLASMPQVVPFQRRVKLFHSLLQHEKLRHREGPMEAEMRMLAMMRGEEGPSGSRSEIRIRRDKLFDDSMTQLSELGSKLKRRVHVTFVNRHGREEAGIDGGGVFKEFIDDVIRDAFSTTDTSTASHRFFTVTPLQTLTVNPDLTRDYTLFPHYEFLGRVLGKAVFESILVEPQFCLPFLNQFLGKSNSIEDLKNYDLEYYQNLTKLLHLKDEELEKLGLTFETTIGAGASARSVELCKCGAQQVVTKKNAIQYVHLLSHHKLNVEGSLQTKAFLKGCRNLIPASWVRLFSPYELQKLISGDDSIVGIDVPAFKGAMQYGGGYHPTQPVMQWFWEVVDEMSASQQNKLLKFMTSCSRQPLLGFESLEPAPCIQQIRLTEAIYEGGEAAKRAPLPTSSTCMNLLKLPNYRSKELLRTKVLSAIESGAGFELT